MTSIYMDSVLFILAANNCFYLISTPNFYISMLPIILPFQSHCLYIRVFLQTSTEPASRTWSPEHTCSLLVLVLHFCFIKMSMNEEIRSECKRKVASHRQTWQLEVKVKWLSAITTKTVKLLLHTEQ
jgi:hypothetical protein